MCVSFKHKTFYLSLYKFVVLFLTELFVESETFTIQTIKHNQLAFSTSICLLQIRIKSINDSIKLHKNFSNFSLHLIRKSELLHRTFLLKYTLRKRKKKVIKFYQAHIFLNWIQHLLAFCCCRSSRRNLQIFQTFTKYKTSFSLSLLGK